METFVQKRFNVNQLKINNQQIPLGFTFSFAFEQLAINKGKAVQFSIGTNLRDVIGKDPVKLFQAAIDKLNLPVLVTVLVNDSTSTLIYGKYLDSDTYLSYIMGSGINIGMIENVKKFDKIVNPIKMFGYDAEQVVINTEFPVLGDDGCIDFIKCKFDLIMDKASLFPSEYT